MAKKRASRSKRRTGSGGKKRASRSSSGRAGRRFKVSEKQAERMALLQLRIGRASHLYSMGAAFALAASGILLLLTQPGRPLEDLPADTKMVLPWLMPILAGTVIAASALYLKWKPYAGERTSAHFTLTEVAFLAAVATLLLLTVQNLQGFDPQSLAWVYPSALAGVSLTLISLAMTWRGWGRRKLLSIFTAGFPMALLVYGFNPIFSTGIPPDLLILTFMGGAVAVLFSGSMLHIASTSTRVQTREMIRVTKDRLQIYSDRVKSQKTALDYKEKALRTKEADLEVNEKALTQRIRSVDEGRRELESLQKRVDQGTKALRQQEKKIASREAEVATQEQKSALQRKDLAKREAEVKKTLKRLSREESQSVNQERKLEKGIVALGEKEKELADREAEVHRLEGEQRGLHKELNRTRKQLREKESELRLKESALEMKGGGVGLAARDASVPRQLKRLEAKLLEKEKELSQRELELRNAAETVRTETRKSEDRDKKTGRRLEKIGSKEKIVSSREREVAQREAALRKQESDLERRRSLMESSLSAVQEKEAKYEELYKQARSQASTARHTEKEVQDGLAAVRDREAKLESRAKKLEQEREAINAKMQTMAREEKELEARESKAKLRVLEAEKKLKGALSARGGDSEAIWQKEKALELWEKRLKEKEQEMKSRLYEKEKSLQEKEHAIKKGLTLTEADELEEREGLDEFTGDRASAGIPRLDDLLLGGIPVGSQILYAGPAFVGKEVAILNFIAEGLRNGIPCVVITTSRPPDELARDMGPILPSYVEYDQLDLIHWIDGSTPLANTKSETPVVEGNSFVVAGGGDYEAILDAMNQIVDKLTKEDHPYFKLAYMTLSTSLTQGNEKDAMSYIQRFVNGMRQVQSVGIYAVEGGMHDKHQIQALEHQMDGAIHFKVDRQKNRLKVAGICDTQTRGWVDYKHNNRTLRLGAFQLERIR